MDIVTAGLFPRALGPIVGSGDTREKGLAYHHGGGGSCPVAFGHIGLALTFFLTGKGDRRDIDWDQGLRVLATRPV